MTGPEVFPVPRAVTTADSRPGLSKQTGGEGSPTFGQTHLRWQAGFAGYRPPLSPFEGALVSHVSRLSPGRTGGTEDQGRDPLLDSVCTGRHCWFRPSREVPKKRPRGPVS